MRRRELISGAVAAAAALATSVCLRPLGARAASARRVAFLSGGVEATGLPLLAAFHGGMRVLGYVENTDYVLEARFAEGKFERLAVVARDLLAREPDVLFVATTPAALAAKAATSTTPIVIVAVADPVGAGLVASLSRPGGNITGITNIAAELAGKRLELLREIIPSARTVAVFVNPDDPNTPLQMRNAEAAAATLGITLRPILPVRGADDLPKAFKAAVEAGAQGALRMVDPLGSALRRQTVALAADYKLPVIFPFRSDAQAGGLLSYGTDLADQYRQAATLVHKVLQGQKPSDIPVEQPTKFEFIINLETAKALGLDVPQTLLARADEVIE